MGMLATLIGHVEAAVWWATYGNGAGGVRDSCVRAAVSEAAAGWGLRASAYPRPGLPTWTALAAGDVSWADLLARPAGHPGERHVGMAALVHAARTGLLGRLLDGAVTTDEPLVGFGLRDGWCVPSPDGAVASPELRAVAGTGVVPDPATWVRARLAFEADWFWGPLGQLPGASGPVADFGSPGRAEAFRAASARLNASGSALRERAARAVAAAVGPVRRTLELGGVSPVWGGALAGNPERTIVDYSSVLLGLPAGVTAVVGDPLRALPRESFDLVVVDELVHTAPRATATALIDAAARRLAPGGRLLIVEPLLDKDRRGPPRLLATQVKVVLTGGGPLWTGKELIDALRARNLRPARPRLVGNAHVSLARL
jgi:SAM-dependent methyltransferase